MPRVVAREIRPSLLIGLSIPLSRDGSAVGGIASFANPLWRGATSIGKTGRVANDVTYGRHGISSCLIYLLLDLYVRCAMLCLGARGTRTSTKREICGRRVATAEYARWHG